MSSLPTSARPSSEAASAARISQRRRVGTMARRIRAHSGAVGWSAGGTGSDDRRGGREEGGGRCCARGRVGRPPAVLSFDEMALEGAGLLRREVSVQVFGQAV